ncbi:hypothetical protein GCM10027169_31070 [Gordonia jinhuaensis]|uniref:Uncharacterized protein n=1 Tax=Gordonia jinhuaensis TaxID=1517702 RepID=A0A916WW04_9ACTN|nr:hypothetical protein [Gordonia jinhuaensis]GGB34965.1 hypothetical protein GCM10011489_23760 [Gordonia jinhuaensis]
MTATTPPTASTPVAQSAATSTPGATSTSWDRLTALDSATVIRALLSLALCGLLVYAFVAAWNSLATPPVIDAHGTVIVDQYRRAVDLAQLILPFITVLMGFWFGSEGKKRVVKQRESAETRLTAVLGASDDPQLLRRAAASAPEAFSQR